MPGKERITDSLKQQVAAALEEDLGTGDVTVESLVPADLHGTGRVLVKENGFISGLVAAVQVFSSVDPELVIDVRCSEGEKVQPGKTLMKITGSFASLLKGERTALNFMQHLSGVATQTSRFVEAVKGFPARILDTRKTTPGLRMLEKAAVKAGGGENHRIGLFDMVLIKDNHLALLDGEDEVKAVAQAVPLALNKIPSDMRVQVEVTCLAAAMQAGRSGAHLVLLDNMSPEAMAEVMVALKREFSDRRPLAEASGGVTLDRVQAIAATGVDRISIGALTHSAPALDIAMYIGSDN